MAYDEKMVLHCEQKCGGKRDGIFKLETKIIIFTLKKND